MSAPSVRQRNLKGESTAKTTPTTSASNVPSEVEDASPVISVLDIIRIIFTLCAASCALSYYTTSGESLLWGYRPWLTRPQLVKAFFVSYAQNYHAFSPEAGALAQISLTTGCAEWTYLPIYLAINGTIYDVSAGRRTYGPGGSYSVFAGRDATRAFVTGCFLDDTTDDMRGAELIYVPIDDDEDEVISSAERKTRAERERRQARKKVQQEVQKWEDFYRTSDKYFEVGKVIGQREHDGPPPKLCESAMKSRLRRSNMKKGTASAQGKPV